MPSKLRDSSPERKRDRKERSRSDKEKSERRERHRSSTHRTSSTKEKTASRTSLSSIDDSKRRSSMPGAIKPEDEIPEAENKSTTPYPTFSKAHSKEAVGSHPSLNLFTPPPTDVDVSKEKSSPSKGSHTHAGPPSPPLTDKNAGRPQRSTTKPTAVETILEEERSEPRVKRKPSRDKDRDKDKDKFVPILRSDSPSSVRQRSSSDAAPIAAIDKPKERMSTPLKRVHTPTKMPQRSVSQPMSQQTRTASPTPSNSATEITVSVGSEATSIAPEQPFIQRPGSKIPPAAVVEDAYYIHQLRAHQQPVSRQQTPCDIIIEDPLPSGTPFSALDGPPPPPPPPVVPISIPRVDYLLQHGGLNQAVAKNLLYAGKPMAIQQAQVHPGQTAIVVANLFEPFNTLLGDYEKVMVKSGSLAVATGYKSVARRLLDRLENVFARDISCESCRCRLCVREPQLEDSRGVSWGEVLELVSGRRELPDWPPFAPVSSPSGLSAGLEIEAPMQKVDIDVPEEYREHYIRQSRKTKQSVDRWLSRQGGHPSNPPEEVDDETLTFTMLTHLPVEQRQAFKDLLGIVDRPLEPPRRAPSPGADSKDRPRPVPTPAPRERTQDVITAGLAVQRLYRLTTVPRDPEVAIFLLNNPTIHNALATLAAISNDEWDILTSGRFDGFLRSGAEDVPDISPQGYVPSRGPSRTGTPGHVNGHRRQASFPSRQPTPAAVPPQYGAPIALDEETEIQILSEIERDIYTGMEALEDAFEALHQRAEAVRRTLRERSAGLAAAQQRRGGLPLGGIDIRSDTPGMFAWETETDDGIDWDGAFEIAPDDSASNISSARRRRPKRRDERRTPAIIEEDDEDYAASDGTQSPRKV